MLLLATSRSKLLYIFFSLFLSHSLLPGLSLILCISLFLSASLSLSFSFTLCKLLLRKLPFHHTAQTQLPLCMGLWFAPSFFVSLFLFQTISFFSSDLLSAVKLKPDFLSTWVCDFWCVFVMCGSCELDWWLWCGFGEFVIWFWMVGVPICRGCGCR